MSDLNQKKCLPCVVGQPPLKGTELQDLRSEIDPAWQVIEEHHIERSFKFKNFVQALAFVNEVGHLAEEEGHHPDIFLTWGLVKLSLFTHKIDGLTESDFIFSAKSDAIYTSRLEDID